MIQHTKLSDEEIALLILNKSKKLDSEFIQKWLSIKENEQLITQMAHLKYALKDIKDARFQITEFKSRERYRILSIAASVIVLLTIGITVLLLNKNTDNLANHHSIKSQIVLTLSNGEQIFMNKNGVPNINISIYAKADSNGGVSYVQQTERETSNDGKIQYNTLKIPTGADYRLTLSDGTKVWLNSESEITYPVQFSSKGDREVQLKGEAYFEVAKDAHRPFIVQVKEASITVLGTSFNINAYKNKVTTTLATGAILFSTNDKQIIQKMEPGMQCIWNVDNKKTIIQKVDPHNYIAWREGRFIFTSISLNEMMEQLERWYGVTCFYQHEEIRTYNFRGVINKDMSLDKVLSIIEDIANVHFTINKNIIIIRKK